MLQQLKRITELKNEREFMSFLREHGVKDENPRFSQLVRAREGKIGGLLEKKPGDLEAGVALDPAAASSSTMRMDAGTLEFRMRGPVG